MAEPNKGGGQLLIKSLKIYHNEVVNIKSAKSTNKFIDLLNVYAGFEIYDSILSPFQAGEMMITDSNDMIADYPLIGGELIHIAYNVSGGTDDTKIDLWFRLTGIKNIAIKERKQIFTIQFISEEGFKNAHTSISSSFTGSPSEIISDVFDNYLFSDSGKKIAIDDALGALKVVCPRWRAFQVINYVMNKAIDIETNAPGFFFFQAMHGFRFLSTSTLFDRNRNVCITDKYAEAEAIRAGGKVKKGYLYKVPGIPTIGSDGKPTSGAVGDETLQNVDDFRVDYRQTYLKDVNDGFLSSKHITHDLFFKNYKVDTYDYFDSYEDKKKKIKRIGKIPHYGIYENKVSSDVKIMLSPKQSRIHAQKKNEEGFRNLFADDYVQGRKHVLKQITDDVVENFVIPGHPLITSGRLVEFNFPSMRKVLKPDDAYQKKYSGLYLIRDCVHIVRPVGNGTAQYKCDTNIVKDGWNA